jgi:hypothetical protein
MIEEELKQSIYQKTEQHQSQGMNLTSSDRKSSSHKESSNIWSFIVSSGADESDSPKDDGHDIEK